MIYNPFKAAETIEHYQSVIPKLRGNPNHNLYSNVIRFDRQTETYKGDPIKWLHQKNIKFLAMAEDKRYNYYAIPETKFKLPTWMEYIETDIFTKHSFI